MDGFVVGLGSVIAGSVLALASVHVSHSNWGGVSLRVGVEDPDDARQSRLVALTSELFELDAGELRATATQEIAAGNSEVVDAIVLRAGRPTPPGVSTARRKQRAERATEALDWLRSELETTEGSERVLASLEAALSPRETGEPEVPVLAMAAMRSATALDLEPAERARLAAMIASYLDREPVDGLAKCAEEALFRMTGRRFTSTESFERVWPLIRDLSSEALGRDALITAEENADTVRLRLLEVAPDRALDDPLNAASAATSAAAARAIGRAVTSGAIGPAEALEWLTDGLAEEPRPRPLHARIETLLDLVQGVAADSDAAREVRSAVLGLATSAGGGSEGPVAQPEGRSLDPARAWIAIGGLPRLVHGSGESGDAARANALAVGTRLFARLLDGRETRLLDPDALQGAVLALIDLARAIEDPAARAAAARPLVERFKRFVTAPGPVPMGVRRAAASGLTLSIRPSDARGLVEIVRNLESTDLEYELLGALREAIAVLAPGSPESRAVLAELFAAAVSDRFDERARALGVLEDVDLRKALAPVERAERVRWAIARAKAEPSAELRGPLLALIGRLGTSEALEVILDDEDLFELVASGGAQTIGSFATALGSLCGEDPADMRRCARSLAGARLVTHRGENGSPASDGGPAAPSPLRIELLREAVRLVIAADAMEGGKVASIADHAFTVRAALELIHLASQFGAVGLEGPERIGVLESHVKPLAADPGGKPYAFETKALRALLGARSAPDWSVASADPSATTQRTNEILADFDAALELLSAPAPAGLTRAALHREAIEFLESIGRPRAALRRFDAWLATTPEVTPAMRRDYVDLVRAELTKWTDPLTPALEETRARRVIRARRMIEDLIGQSDANTGDAVTSEWARESILGDAPGAALLRAELVNVDGGESALKGVRAFVENLGVDR